MDDHIVEPRDAFEGRFPKALADEAPRVVEKADGSEAWIYAGQEMPNVGFNAVVGRPVTEYSFEPTRFDEMRRGAWDIHARVRDMDLTGVWASMNFPSFLPGFAGQRLQLTGPGGVWKASHLPAGDYGLISEAVSPGFEYEDMQLGERSTLLQAFPEHAELIHAYTPDP